MAQALPRGSIAAVPTPLTIDGLVDQDALQEIINHVVNGGCSGLLVLGSSGEVAALSAQSRRQVVISAVDAAGDRCPVIVGIASPSMGGALDDLATLQDVSVTAALIVPPFYGNLSQSEVGRFYRTLAKNSDVPLLGYNIPAFTGIRIDVSTATRLADEGVLAGIKDSGRDLEYFQQIAAISPPSGNLWMSYIGTDSLLLPALIFGASGGITLAASIAPLWTSALVHAANMGEYTEASALQTKITNLILALRRGTYPAGAKAALSLLGYGSAELVAPASGLSPDEIIKLGEDLCRIGVPGFESRQSGES
ncbi:MAG: dihydrodipicolinate synthase family protein [Actinobacteria bacterium]|nr:dihydrodipicolinate synthase family protein [Actinomycetota bacterium]